jgi:hypothetical protein
MIVMPEVVEVLDAMLDKLHLTNHYIPRSYFGAHQ